MSKQASQAAQLYRCIIIRYQLSSHKKKLNVTRDSFYHFPTVLITTLESDRKIPEHETHNTTLKQTATPTGVYSRALYDETWPRELRRRQIVIS
jgi:hypothetical protein